MELQRPEWIGKRMIGRRIGCLLLLAAGFYFIMLYDFPGLRFLLCCTICLPLASLFLLAPKAFLCRVSISAEQSFVTRGEIVRILLRVENKGIFPISRLRMRIRWKPPGEREIKVKKWVYGLGRGGEEVILELSASHCGEAAFSVVKAGICDYLGLFLLPVKAASSVKFCITPVITPLIGNDQELLELFSRNTGQEQEGDVALREYRWGDSMHKVYWKLAAKLEELQVREAERSESVTLYLKHTELFKANGETWDRYLDRACSFLYFFAEENKDYLLKPEVIWHQRHGYWKYKIDNIEALQSWVCALLTQEEAGIPVSEEEVVFLEQGCHLDEDCKVYFGEQCVYE